MVQNIICIHVRPPRKESRKISKEKQRGWTLISEEAPITNNLEYWKERFAKDKKYAHVRNPAVVDDVHALADVRNRNQVFSGLWWLPG